MPLVFVAHPNKPDAAKQENRRTLGAVFGPKPWTSSRHPAKGRMCIDVRRQAPRPSTVFKRG